MAATGAALVAWPLSDVMMNNAATSRPKSFTEALKADCDAVMGPNVRAALFVAQAAARGLIAAGRPRSAINLFKLGRLGQRGDLMGAFVFLASGASALMTVSAMVIDDGWTAE